MVHIITIKAQKKFDEIILKIVGDIRDWNYELFKTWKSWRHEIKKPVLRSYHTSFLTYKDEIKFQHGRK